MLLETHFPECFLESWNVLKITECLCHYRNMLKSHGGFSKIDNIVDYKLSFNN